MTKLEKFAGENSVFAQRLKEIMKEHSVTQQQLADELNMTRQAVSLYLNGQALPAVDKLLTIVNYFDISADYLMGRSDVKSTDENIQMICEYTGLSENAIPTLVKLKEKRDSRAYIDLLSCIISNADFEYLLGLFEGYIVPDKEMISASFSMSRADINYKDLCLFAINNALKYILDDVSEGFTQKYKTTDERLDILFEKKKK